MHVRPGRELGLIAHRLMVVGANEVFFQFISVVELVFGVRPSW
jgi:hypothetical protein